MTGSKISQLPSLTEYDAADQLLVTDVSEQSSKSISLGKLVRDAIYGIDSDVIVKCCHCGQWGAVKTPCRKCGAPIDPPAS